jgi:acetyl-CoA carboxylase carboxyl transferase subunit beta
VLPVSAAAGRGGPRSVDELLAVVLDDGTWRSWDSRVDAPDPATGGYAATLARARERSGLDEAVITGEGRIRGRRVAVVACEFTFLAGSIGVAAGRRLTAAVERATRERLPLLATPASGGTRLQEGTVAFLQMLKVTAAVVEHKAAGLPYLVYLRHPTTGGVLASWGSLGHLTAAEPGALVGFLGPRVYEALHGKPFPAGVQVAEHLHAHGLVDAVLPAAQVAEALHRVLRVFDGAQAAPGGRATEAGAGPGPAAEAERAPATESGAADGAGVAAAEAVRRSRREDRPGLRELLAAAATDVTPLSGTGAGEREPGLVLALARFGAASCLVVGQDRRGQRVRRLGPAGLREAQRGMHLASELRLPLVTVVDTPGAALSPEAEEGGLAAEIARCLAELIALPTPTLCVLLGEGAGGAALALVPADRVVAAQHAWLSPLPPEAASAVLHRTTARADEMAEQQGIRALDLRTAGLVDRIVDEAPTDGDAFLRRLGAVVEVELAALVGRADGERRAARRRRFRRLGTG